MLMPIFVCRPWRYSFRYSSTLKQPSLRSRHRRSLSKGISPPPVSHPTSALCSSAPPRPIQSSRSRPQPPHPGPKRRPAVEPSPQRATRARISWTSSAPAKRRQSAEGHLRRARRLHHQEGHMPAMCPGRRGGPLASSGPPRCVRGLKNSLNGLIY